MKKNLFYYSEKKLKYIEIKNFYVKFVSLIALFSTVFAFIFLGGYIFISSLLLNEKNASELVEENEILKEKYIDLSTQINTLYSELENLSTKEKDLRTSVNLDPANYNSFGIGGSEFENIEPTTISDISDLVSEVDNSLDILKSKVLVAKDNYEKIEEALNNNLELYKSIPAILPTDGLIGDRFGMRMHPILKIRRMHPGIDIVVNTGEKIYAPGNGKVISSGNRGGYGLTIEIDHGFGYTTLYAHLSKINVKKGQLVKRGELIGLSGETGSLATGPHLHYEIKHNGVLLNPKNFIFNDMKVFDIITQKGSN
ncbi:MAG: M23 family metallopeptidase [Ignavibacteriae bacterium]|nr:M23 family metallopeptidase [Ignavibacteriota bacterium]MCB9206935.1 M23 family metallopeptidase [Ignavibacteriales bacterium]MCB9209843.1 M23 family metallopeptidase [Ignavibacteriales bacterium]MCB9219000.1 M23 family metallopeptidase [Ignavibacteriales bacterium]